MLFGRMDSANNQTVLMTQATGDFIEFTALMGNKDIETEPHTKTNLATSQPALFQAQFDKAITKISERRVLFTRSNEKREKEADYNDGQISLRREWDMTDSVHDRSGTQSLETTMHLTAMIQENSSPLLKDTQRKQPSRPNTTAAIKRNSTKMFQRLEKPQQQSISNFNILNTKEMSQTMVDFIQTYGLKINQKEE